MERGITFILFVVFSQSIHWVSWPIGADCVGGEGTCDLTRVNKELGPVVDWSCLFIFSYEKVDWSYLLRCIFHCVRIWCVVWEWHCLSVMATVTKAWNTLRDFCPDFPPILQSEQVDASWGKSEPVCRLLLTDSTENHVVYYGHRLFLLQSLILSSRRISNMFDIFSRF